MPADQSLPALAAPRSVGPAPVWPDRRGIIAWCFFDWANSAFPTLIVTFVFSTYFTQSVAPDPKTGTLWWGQMTSIAALCIGIFSPVLGAIADRGGRRKPWLIGFTLICALATANLWWAAPAGSDAGLSDVAPLLLLAGLGIFSFEVGTVFYNALLPSLVPPDRVGRLSGWAWGLGYAGGLTCLIVSLVMFILPEHPPFGLDPSQAEQIRIIAPVASLWVLLFALPLFLWTPDRGRAGLPPGLAVKAGLRALGRTLRGLPAQRPVLWFLLAQMLYLDGLNTIFAFGGIFAAAVYGFSVQDVLVFGILLNVTAGIGAFLFGWVDDWLGPRRTIMLSLGMMIIVAVGILLIDHRDVFYGLGLTLGLFFGPAQAASRSMMAVLAPPRLRAEYYGLSALSGRATSFLGPALYGWVTAITGDQRAGMASVLPFLMGGLVLLFLARPRPANA